MATLADDKQISYVLGDIGETPMIAADIIYEGAAVGEVAASGHARPLVAGDKFLGFAEAKADNSAGAAAARNVRYKFRGIAVVTLAGALITNLGEALYASDDDTFTLTATSNSFIGYVHRYVNASTVEVAFNAGAAQL